MNQEVKMIKLGDRVRQTISQIEGVVVGRIQYLDSTNQSLVEYRTTNGEARREWFEEARLEVIEAGAVKPGQVVIGS